MLRAPEDTEGDHGNRGTLVQDGLPGGWWDVVEAWVGMVGGRSPARISEALAKIRRGLRAADSDGVAADDPSVLQEIVQCIADD